jgi:hypothetical protein
MGDDQSAAVRARAVRFSLSRAVKDRHDHDRLRRYLSRPDGLAPNLTASETKQKSRR